MTIKTRNSVKTREIILKKATRLFIQKGFKGTSTTDIVKASGYNKRMIYHYFDSKEGLYQTVFNTRLQAFGTLIESQFSQLETLDLDTGKSTKKTFQAIISYFFDLLSSNKDLVKLLIWNELESKKVFTNVWDKVTKPLFDQTEAVAIKAIEIGEISSNIDAKHLVATFWGMITSYFTSKQVMDSILQRNSQSKDSLQKQKEFILGLLDRLY